MINNLLSDFFCRQHGIDVNAPYEIEYVDARELLSPFRLDLLPKIRWIEAHDTGIARTYANEYYCEHIKAITGRTRKEAGQEERKNSIDAFIKTFEELANSIRCEGFNPDKSVIPVDRNGIIMDGAHRTAIGIYYDLKVPIIRLKCDYSHADVEFFQRYLLDDFYREQLIRDYCTLTDKSVYAICLWPRATGKEKRRKAEELINTKCLTLYKKEIPLSHRALRYFIMQVYHDFDWMGGIEDYFSGASVKADLCWAENNVTTVYFVEAAGLDGMLKLKNEIRDIFQVENHSVHITDNNAETVSVANLVLNANSLDLMERGVPEKSKKLNYLIERFKKQIFKEHKSLENFIVDSSSVLCLYGLREVGDLDYACIGDNIDNIDNIDNHINYIKYHGVDKGEMVRNPRYCLYYHDVKFITLEMCRVFKTNRGEEKDKIDVAMIDDFGRGQFSLGQRLKKLNYSTERYCRFYWMKFKSSVSKIKVVASVYRWLKSKTHGR